MKQLKFMLAAATAIGLATASQAAEQTNPLVDNENFDSLAAGTLATDIDGYEYLAADEDNESAVVAGGYNSSLNALQVNTGTNPLLRALDYSETANKVDLTGVKSLYIDTMVQFTVTPAGDTVEAGPTDKLMIYLQEVAEEKDEEGNVTVAAATNLMVKAGVTQVDEITGDVTGFGADDVAVAAQGLVVQPNVWYNLRVVAAMSGEVPTFTIFVNNLPLVATKSMMAGDTTNKIFPSLLGTSDTDLTYVGFAGEGLVDNLTVATVTEVTTVDFTIAWNTDGFSAVTYTINGGSALTPVNGVKFTINPGDDIVITPVLADWYKRTDSSALTYTDVAANQSVTFAASKVDQSNAFTPAEEGGAAPTATAVAEALQITNDAFKGTDAAAQETLTAAIKWAQANSYAPTKLNEASFSGVVPANQTAEAFLLDCADDKEAVAAKKAAFKFPAFTPGSVPAIDEDFTHNGTVTIKGATAVDGEWTAADAENHKFFKAVLTK